MIITKRDLLAQLEDFDDDQEICLNYQENHPLEATFAGVTSEGEIEGNDPKEGKIILVAGDDTGYGQRAAWDFVSGD